MTYRTIDPTCLPMRCPLVATIAFFLLLDRLGAPGWVWGLLGGVMALCWVLWIASLFENESVPVAGFGKIKKQKASL